MIINYATKTQDIRDSKKVIYWFEVRLHNQKWTSICIAFNDRKEFLTASETFFDLPIDVRNQILSEAQSLVEKVVS